MKKILFTLVLSICVASSVFSANKCKLTRLEPASWWVGMHDPQLQLLCYGPSISSADIEIDYPGVTINEKIKTDNPDYLFVYLNISKDTKAGTFPIVFKNNGKKIAKCTFQLKERIKGSADRKSFGVEDAVYLVMPDRFANGNEKNDQQKDYIQAVDRTDKGARHGGDLAGLISKIPYISDLGCTALWMTPFFDNNDSQYSYHHYATSDYYKVDPRLGTNADYKSLSDSCHANDMKLIIDVVPNHCGGTHWWMQSLPSSDWVHKWPKYTSSNYRMTAWTDPHGADIDRQVLEKGWFSYNMPDLNLENPLLFKYLSQVYIWWIEYGNVDGIRVDTYPYNNINIASAFMKTFRDEYPAINIVGECWVKSPLEISYYQSGNNNKDGFDSNLPSVMDFVLKDVLHMAFNENDGWDSGMSRFYSHYAQDFAYPNINNLMNFLDNHDIDRFSGSVDYDINKYKMGVAMLLTTRGFPQIYAGDEIMLDGIQGNYEGYRFDFPGGWKEDSRNAFTQEGRTPKENEVFNYMRKILNYRKQNTALQTGKMKQFIPYDGIYLFSRYDQSKTIVMIFNNNNQTKVVSLERYEEVFDNYTSGTEITTEKQIDLTQYIAIPAKTAWIIELNK